MRTTPYEKLKNSEKILIVAAHHGYGWDIHKISEYFGILPSVVNQCIEVDRKMHLRLLEGTYNAEAADG